MKAAILPNLTPAAVNPVILRKAVMSMFITPGKFATISPYLLTIYFILAAVGLLRVSERLFKKG